MIEQNLPPGGVKELAERTLIELNAHVTLLDEQLKKGKFAAARDTLKGFKVLVKLQERITRDILGAAR